MTDGDLRALADVGVLDFEREGRARRPVVSSDRLTIEIELA